MAEGILTALQAALSGIGGGIEGAAQYREMERRRKKEEEATRRQTRLDEAAIRAEERQAINADMIPAQRFASMTMPGATPMEPALRQTIGGREFVFAPEINAAEKHRADVMNERKNLAKKATEQTDLAKAFAGVEVAGKPLFSEEQAARVAKLPSNERSSLVSAAIRAATPDRGGKEELPDWKKRELGAEFLSAQVFNPALARALQTRFARNPNEAADPEMVAYEIMARKTVKPITPLQRYKPTKPKEPKEGDALDAAVKEEMERRKGGAAGTPTAKPSTAKKTSVVDNELTEQRKLWDDAVAKHGRDKVIREFGERP